MTEWSRLRDAYGSAEDLPSVRESAESSGDWDEAYSRLFHQATTYTASFAPLPMLTEMALRQPAAGHVAAMDLAAAPLRALFGTARCPSCPAEFDIAAAIV